MSRKMIGVSDHLHQHLSEVARASGVPMTVVLSTLIDMADQVDWKSIKESYLETKPTWKNIRKTIEEYQERYPKADDTRLAELTGFSVAQVETVTHTAHKRCLAAIKDQPKVKPEALAKKAGVSSKFAKRIWEQAQGVSRIPHQEQYLWNLSGSTPIPKDTA